MLLKLISTTLPITLNPFSQFLVFIWFWSEGGEDGEGCWVMSWLPFIDNSFWVNVTTCIKQFSLAKTMALNHGDHSDVKVSSSVRQLRVSGFKDGILQPGAHGLHSATFKLQALCQGPLAKLLARDLFFGFLWCNLDWINLNHANLSFLNFQLDLSMAYRDRASGIRQSSACCPPPWWSSSWQPYAWPKTFTGHVPNLGWWAWLAAVQLLKTIYSLLYTVYMPVYMYMIYYWQANLNSATK